MSYTKTVWSNGDLITALKLNNIEDGVEANNIWLDNLQDQIDDLSDSVADEYSTSGTYAVGDYVIYEGELYRCTTAIANAEAWTAGHWTKVALANDVAEIFKEYITPEMFGAKGDGITDDTTALQNASNYSYSNNIPLYCFKKYKITDTITFKKDVLVIGEIQYYGTNIAVIVDGRDNTNYWGAKYSFNVSNKGAESTTSIGVKVININNALLEFNRIEDFYNSVMLLGDGGGCCYNKVFIDMLYNYHTGLSLINDNGGWVNENTFYGGRFVRKTAHQNDSIGVLMDSIDTTHLNQNNTFLTPCIESSKIGFYLKYGRNNNVIKLRSEGTATVLKADSPSYGNIIDVAYGSYSMDSPSAVNYIIKYRQDRIGEKINKLVFDSGDLANKCASNSSGASCPSLYLYKHGTGKLPIMPSVQSNENGLEFVTGSYGFAGVLVNVNDSRIFELFIDSISTVNFGILQLDSNGAIIDEIPPQYLSYELFESSQGASKIGVDQYYQSGAYIEPYVFGVSQNCVKFYIFVKYAGTGHILKRMKIYTDNNATYENLTDDIVLDSIPTSTGYDGQFVKAETPTASCIGWMYFNNQWNIVPL